MGSLAGTMSETATEWRGAAREPSLLGNLSSYSEYNAEWEISRSTKQSFLKRAENINKPHRKEPWYETASKPSHWSPEAHHREHEFTQ